MSQNAALNLLVRPMIPRVPSQQVIQSVSSSLMKMTDFMTHYQGEMKSPLCLTSGNFNY